MHSLTTCFETYSLQMQWMVYGAGVRTPWGTAMSLTEIQLHSGFLLPTR